MLAETLNALQLKSGGVYVDATFGGGGHSRAILEKIESGKLFAFDQDTTAALNAKSIKKGEEESRKFFFIRANFRYLKHFLTYYKIKKIDGILADLGVSSHQFDTPERGFSYRFDGPADMRMNNDAFVSASHVLSNYSEEELSRIFREYGELKEARKIAKLIAEFRQNNRFNDLNDLKQAVSKAVPKNAEYKYWGQIFQALRIEVNSELEALKELLVQIPDYLRTGAPAVFLTYHSLEDRLVKNYFKAENFEGVVEKDVFGQSKCVFESSRLIKPSEEELKINSRASSAKLRVAIRA
jgi:16S rRNA (cytosine1402-N4)-methyltransferase